MFELRISATSHGLNYLPEYFAEHTGAFAERGLTVIDTPRDPWTGVLDDLADGTADVALGGLWVPAMYAGRGRDLVTIGQLNARFPMVFLTRDPVVDFDWTWAAGRTVLVPGAGGTAMYEFTAGLMRESGFDPTRAKFVRDLSSEMLGELFEHGLGDAMVVDVLTASRLEQAGVGYAACRLAEVGGVMPNSVYYVRRDRVAELFDRLVALVGGVHAAATAIRRGADVSDTLTREWPELPLDILLRETAALASNDTWSSVRVDPAACERWITILRNGGLVTTAVTHADLVDDSVVDAIATSTPPPVR